GPDPEKNVGISDRRNRNYLATLNHCGEIHKVLNGLHVELPGLGDLSSQEPMPILVVAELWWNFQPNVSGFTSILLYSFHTPRPQIRIVAARAGLIGHV